MNGSKREHDWRDGMREASDDPRLQSPREELFQPVRGIGQIWAESLFVQQALGWATAPPEKTSVYCNHLKEGCSYTTARIKKQSFF